MIEFLMQEIMIYIVRHGQTDWNVVGRYQGRKDIELNQKGKEQARKIKEQLKDVDYDLIFLIILQISIMERIY